MRPAWEGRPLKLARYHTNLGILLGGREGADPNVLARALLAALNKLLPSDHDPTHEGGWTAPTLTAPTFRLRDAD